MTDKTLGALATGPDPLIVSDLIPLSRGGTVTDKVTLQKVLEFLGDELASAFEYADQTGDYTFVLGDQSTTGTAKIIRATGTVNQTFTVPDNATQDFPVGAQINIAHRGTATLTIAGGTGVTVHPPPDGTLEALGTGAVLVLIQLAVDEWQLIGPTVLQ